MSSYNCAVSRSVVSLAIPTQHGYSRVYSRLLVSPLFELNITVNSTVRAVLFLIACLQPGYVTLSYLTDVP